MPAAAGSVAQARVVMPVSACPMEHPAASSPPKPISQPPVALRTNWVVLTNPSHRAVRVAKAVAQAPASTAAAPVGDALVLDPLWQRTPTWRGERINLPLTAQRILATLHQRSGEVVSYDELFEVVKSGRNRDNVRKHVSTIREALREVDPSFEGIENVPMRGFRWTGR